MNLRNFLLQAVNEIDVNPVIVHTPVECAPAVKDDRGFNQEIDADRSRPSLIQGNYNVEVKVFAVNSEPDDGRIQRRENSERRNNVPVNYVAEVSDTEISYTDLFTQETKVINVVR